MIGRNQVSLRLLIRVKSGFWPLLGRVVEKKNIIYTNKLSGIRLIYIDRDLVSAVKEAML